MDSSHTPAVQLPQGVQVEVDLPPHSVLPDANGDKAIAIMAALNTKHFPVLRARTIEGINGRITAWR